MGSRYKIPALPKLKKLNLTQERKVSEEEEKLEPKGILKNISKELPRITLTRKGLRN